MDLFFSWRGAGVTKETNIEREKSLMCCYYWISQTDEANWLQHWCLFESLELLEREGCVGLFGRSVLMSP